MRQKDIASEPGPVPNAPANASDAFVGCTLFDESPAPQHVRFEEQRERPASACSLAFAGSPAQHYVDQTL
jgi:hypothetical protein